MNQRPGAALARRPLHLIWLADVSGSMRSDGKIQALNVAIKEAIPHLRDVASSNPHADLLVRCLSFSSGCRWEIETPTPIETLVWADLEAYGYTDLGAALVEVAGQMQVPPMEERALPPALVLISDGRPTDEWEQGLETLMAQPWGQRAARLGIAIGRDADDEVLRRFIGDPEIEPCSANNPEQLLHFLRWASTVAVKAASEVNFGDGGLAVPTPTSSVEVDLTW